MPSEYFHAAFFAHGDHFLLPASCFLLLVCFEMTGQLMTNRACPAERLGQTASGHSLGGVDDSIDDEQLPAPCEGWRWSSGFLINRSHCCCQFFEVVFSCRSANLRLGAPDRLMLTSRWSLRIDIHSFDSHINKENLCRSHPS